MRVEKGWAERQWGIVIARRGMACMANQKSGGWTALSELRSYPENLDAPSLELE